MSSLKAIAPSTPGIIPEIAGDFIKHLEVAVNGMLKLAIKIHAEKPDVVIVLSPEQPILHHRFAISSAQVVRAFSSNVDESRHIELSFPTDSEFVDTLADRAFDAKIQLEKYTQNEGVVAIDNAALGLMYFLHHVGVDVPVVMIGVSDLSLKKHITLGNLIEDTLEESGKHGVIVAVGAYDTTSIYTETFIDHLTEQGTLAEYLSAQGAELIENTATSLLYPAAILSGALQKESFHELAKQPLGEEGYLVGYFDRK